MYTANSIELENTRLKEEEKTNHPKTSPKIKMHYLLSHKTLIEPQCTSRRFRKVGTDYTSNCATFC